MTCPGCAKNGTLSPPPELPPSSPRTRCPGLRCSPISPACATSVLPPRIFLPPAAPISPGCAQGSSPSPRARSEPAESKESRIRAAIALVTQAKDHYEVLSACKMPHCPGQTVEEWAGKAHRSLAVLLHPAPHRVTAGSVAQQHHVAIGRLAVQRACVGTLYAQCTA